MSLLATNILQRKAPKVLSLQAFQGVTDRQYRRVLLMFDKGDGGVKGAGCVKELLGEKAFESGMIDAFSGWGRDKVMSPLGLLRQKTGKRDEIGKQRFVFGGEMGGWREPYMISTKIIKTTWIETFLLKIAEQKSARRLSQRNEVLFFRISHLLFFNFIASARCRHLPFLLDSQTNTKAKTNVCNCKSFDNVIALNENYFSTNKRNQYFNN